MAGRMKVMDLAKELGVTSKDLVVALEGMGHKGMRAMSPLPVTTANELRVKLGRGRELPAESKPKRAAKPKEAMSSRRRWRVRLAVATETEKEACRSDPRVLKAPKVDVVPEPCRSRSSRRPRSFVLRPCPLRRSRFRPRQLRSRLRLARTGSDAASHRAEPGPGAASAAPPAVTVATPPPPAPMVPPRPVGSAPPPVVPVRPAAVMPPPAEVRPPLLRRHQESRASGSADSSAARCRACRPERLPFHRFDLLYPRRRRVPLRRGHRAARQAGGQAARPASPSRRRRSSES